LDEVAEVTARSSPTPDAIALTLLGGFVLRRAGALRLHTHSEGNHLVIIITATISVDVDIDESATQDQIRDQARCALIDALQNGAFITIEQEA
jgi:hypothetical protein